MSSTAATVAMDTELRFSRGWGQRWGRGAFGRGEYRDEIPKRWWATESAHRGQQRRADQLEGGICPTLALMPPIIGKADLQIQTLGREVTKQ